MSGLTDLAGVEARLEKVFEGLQARQDRTESEGGHDHHGGNEAQPMEGG
jgi:hypothetical protein